MKEPPQTPCDLFRIGNLNEADRAAEAELRRTFDIGNTSDLWKARFVRSDILSVRGHTEEALQYLESLEPPDPRDTESCAALRMRRGRYSASLGRLLRAHELLAEAGTVAGDANLLDLLGEVRLSRAFVFFLQKDYASSDREFRAALSLSDRGGGWYLRGSALWGIGKNLMIQGHYPEAMPWLQQSVEIFEAAGARLDLAMVWSELAVCYLGLGQDEDAMALFRGAEKANEEAGFVHNYQVVLANIGNVYLQRRDYLMAVSYYRGALNLAREIKDPVSIKKWTYNINLAYARIRGDVDRGTTLSGASTDST